MIREPQVFEAPPDLVKELREYVMREHRQKHHGAETFTDHQDEHIEKFKAWCQEIFDEHLEFDILRWDFWASMLTDQDTDGEWCHGFPHNHTWDGVTLTLYLQTSDEGGDLVITENDQEEFRFSPCAGQAVIVGGHDDHGVERIVGKTPRVTIIATVFPTAERR